MAVLPSTDAAIFFGGIGLSHQRLESFSFSETITSVDSSSMADKTAELTEVGAQTATANASIFVESGADDLSTRFQARLTPIPIDAYFDGIKDGARVISSESHPSQLDININKDDVERLSLTASLAEHRYGTITLGNNAPDGSKIDTITHSYNHAFLPDNLTAINTHTLESGTYNIIFHYFHLNLNNAFTSLGIDDPADFSARIIFQTQITSGALITFRDLGVIEFDCDKTDTFYTIHAAKIVDNIRINGTIFYNGDIPPPSPAVEVHARFGEGYISYV